MLCIYGDHCPMLVIVTDIFPDQLSKQCCLVLLMNAIVTVNFPEPFSHVRDPFCHLGKKYYINYHTVIGV